MKNKKFLLLLFLFPMAFTSHAQLKFPNGTVLNLNTHINFLYFETEILFHTGKFPINQYSWEKTDDSVDDRWLIGSCFNGDCWNGLPAKGTFVKDFGMNDTTGFIRFHVETYDTNGKSVIKYRVVNNNDPSDQALLTFNITFEKVVGISNNQSHLQPITIFRNTGNNTIRFHFNKAEPLLSGRIIDMQGRTTLNLPVTNNDFTIDQLTEGIYIIELKSVKNIYNQKFIRN